MNDYKEDIGTTNRRLINIMDEDLCSLGFRIKKLETSLKRQTLRNNEDKNELLFEDIVTLGRRIEELEKKTKNYLELIKYLCNRNFLGVRTIFADRMYDFVSENGYAAQGVTEAITEIENNLLGEG